MLVCEQCRKAWDRDDQAGTVIYGASGIPGSGWWQIGQQLVNEDGSPLLYLSQRRDFCSEACIGAYYQRFVAGTTRRVPTLAKKAR